MARTPSIHPKLAEAFAQGGPDFPQPAYRSYCIAESQAVAIDVINRQVPGAVRLLEWVGDNLRHAPGLSPEKRLGYAAVMQARHELLAERSSHRLLRPRILMAETALSHAGDFKTLQAAKLRKLREQRAINLAFAEEAVIDHYLEECGADTLGSVVLTMPDGTAAAYSQLDRLYGQHELFITDPTDVALRRGIHRHAWKSRLPDTETNRLLSS